jgi:hypothetical protein
MFGEEWKTLKIIFINTKPHSDPGNLAALLDIDDEPVKEPIIHLYTDQF